MLPIEQACYWLAGLPARDVTPLAAPTETGIAIIGGGLTGFWTALFLKELDPSGDVAVVEQGTAAWGASGRNAGMLSETVDHSHGLAIQHFGEKEARRLAGLGQSNVQELVAFIRNCGIECDYEPSGRLTVALTEGHLEEGRRSVDIAKRLGIDTFRMLSREETQAEVHSPLYAGAGVAIQANGTMLKARRAVLAASAYTHHLLPSVRHRFIPLYDYILVSEPLTAAQWELIGWGNRQGITDGRTFFNYYRPTADGRVLWGTSEAAYYSGNRVDPSCDHSPHHYETLRASWRRHFPALADLDWPYAWGGAICSTTRLTPFFGRALGGRASYGLGFTGHGLGSTRIAGRILAHLSLDRASDLLDLSLVTRRPFPYPPEPLRGWAVNAVTSALRRVDAGESPSLMLQLLDRMGLGFSS